MAITLQCQLKIDPTPSLSLELFPADISLRFSKIPCMLRRDPGTMEVDVTTPTLFYVPGNNVLLYNLLRKKGLIF